MPKQDEMVCVMLPRCLVETCAYQMETDGLDTVEDETLHDALVAALSAPPPVKAWMYREAPSAYADPNATPRKQIARTRRAARIMGHGAKHVLIIERPEV